MLNIEGSTISDVLDKQKVFRQQEGWRKLAIGDNWTRIRIGWRHTVENVASDLGNPDFWIGLLSNPATDLSNGVLTNSTSCFIGMGKSSSNHSWTFNTTPIAHYQGSLYPIRKIGSTVNSTTGQSSRRSAVRDVRTVIIMQMVRTSSTNIAFQWTHCSGTAALVDIDKDSLITAMATDFTGTISGANTFLNSVVGGSGTRYAASSVANLTVDSATDGPMNHIGYGFGFNVNIYLSELLFAAMA